MNDELINKHRNKLCIAYRIDYTTLLLYNIYTKYIIIQGPDQTGLQYWNKGVW